MVDGVSKTTGSTLSFVVGVQMGTLWVVLMAMMLRSSLTILLLITSPVNVTVEEFQENPSARGCCFC